MVTFTIAAKSEIHRMTDIVNWLVQHPLLSPSSLLSCITEGRKLFKKNKFIYLFLSVLGLHCCARTFSSCHERGLLFVAVCGLLIAVASLIAKHGL